MTREQHLNRPSGAVVPLAAYAALLTVLVALNGWYGVSVVVTVLTIAAVLWAGCHGWARILRHIAADRHVEAALTDRHGPRMTPRTLERQGWR